MTNFTFQHKNDSEHKSISTKEPLQKKKKDFFGMIQSELRSKSCQNVVLSLEDVCEQEKKPSKFDQSGGQGGKKSDKIYLFFLTSFFLYTKTFYITLQ